MIRSGRLLQNLSPVFHEINKPLHLSASLNVIWNASREKALHSKPQTFTNRYSNQNSRQLSQSNESENEPVKKPTKSAGQLAKVFAEYGTTAVVFHTTISLTSLGICYMAVSR